MNWRDTILRAEKRGNFSEREIKRACIWTTCACGEQDPRIPRLPISRLGGGAPPSDAVLSQYGCDFAVQVRSAEFGNALLTLEKIERRAAQIMALVRCARVRKRDKPRRQPQRRHAVQRSAA